MTDETRGESDALKDLPESTSDAVSEADQAKVKGGQSIVPGAMDATVRPVAVDAALTIEGLKQVDTKGSFI